MAKKKERSGPKKKNARKASEPALTGNRKLSRYGKKIKKGQMGPTSWYITRNAALRKLQVNLKDFRRLCILKGVFPREPDNAKSELKQKTLYHMKDIRFLSHEPLLHKFRSIKAFMSKVRNRLGKKNLKDATRLYERCPSYTLDHLVKERYPTFEDALEDLDDALCLISLFANLPCSNVSNSDWLNIPSETTEKCALLIKEWQLYLSKSHSLRKIFISVKGVYYEAKISDVSIVWIQPYKFSQNISRDIDFRIMNTFLEFYICLLSFVLFKLYYDKGMKYPPVLDKKKDNDGQFLKSLQLQKLKSDSPEEVKEIKDSPKEKIQDMTDIVKDVQEEVLEDVEDSDSDVDLSDNESVFEDDELKKSIKIATKKLKVFKNLFQNKVFFVSREVPFEIVEFCILSFGGKIISDQNIKKVTHFISDRNSKKVITSQTYKDNFRSFTKEDVDNIEFVQPQWIFDSINSQILLPCSKYSVDVEELPPHLSPFVNDNEEGYIPEYRKQIENLKASKVLSVEEYSKLNLVGDTHVPEQRSALLDAKRTETDSGGEEEEESSGDEEEEENEEDSEIDQQSETEVLVEKTVIENFIASKRYNGLKKGYVFKNGNSGLGYYKDNMKKRQVQFIREARPMSNRERKRREKLEMKDMGKIVMKKKAKRLYQKMQHGIKQKQDKNELLKRKRDNLKQKKTKKSRDA